MTPTGRTVHALDAAGYVRDWLVTPAFATPCADLAEVLDAEGDPWGADGRWVLTNGPDVAPLKEKLYRRHPLELDRPLPAAVEGGPVRWAGGEGVWTRAHTGADGLVDWTQFSFTPDYRRALASTVLEVDQAEYRTLAVGCTGPVAAFVNGELVGSHEDFAYMEPNWRGVRVRLPSGTSTVHLVTWQVAFRECRHVVGLRVDGLPVRVVIPSPGADEYVAAQAERILDSVGVGPWAAADGVVTLTGPAGARLAVAVGDGEEREVPLAGGRAELKLTEPGADGPAILRTGETTLRLRVADPRAPIVRLARAAVLPPHRRAEPVGRDPAAWRDELLRHVADGAPGIARALARHALDPAARLADADLAPALHLVDSRADCADFEAVGLVHLWRRPPEGAWSAAQRERVRAALLAFKYWIDQPGLDAMCYFTENHQFVWHTAETLIGELFADRTFANTGWTGARHAEHGRALAQDWLRAKLAGGFSEFDSNAYLAIDSLALVSLVEYAESDGLRRLAEALLDKALLTLAANSWRGMHGAAHGRSYVPTLRSSRFEETAPIMWALWGAGSLNAAVLPATALATARHYALPELIRSVATEPPAEWLGRQVYRGDHRFRHDLLDRPYGSDLRVWRTPDAMLSSVQAYRPGLPGLQEHIWGATLGPEVQVFATHPAADTTNPSARPNAWAGQRVLPRAHQHRDAVLVLHRFPAGDRAGATHLWFPTQHLDEWVSAGPWLAGRVGRGYVAVAAEGGFAATVAGDEAGQAWRPVAGGRAYVATVGRAAVDGTFAEFVAALAAPEFGPDSVRWQGSDGRALALSWSGAFTVDGAVPDGLDPPHLDNPAVTAAFGDERLDARWGGHRLVLDLVEGRRLVPASGVPEVVSEVPRVG